MKALILGMLLLLPSLGFAQGDWHTFTDTKGRKLVGKILKVEADSVLVELKGNGRQVRLAFDSLSQEDIGYVKIVGVAPETAKPADSQPATSAPEDEPGKSRLYPRSKEEIRAGIREIEKRPKPADVSKDIHEATQQLNIYRFLCGVPSEVKPDPDFSKNAEDAALACKKNGGLSHALGHSTDKCNLSSVPDVKASVGQYIEDSGDNNRDVRGHREWCLNPPMGKVGFGSGGDSYSAMWCMDSSGKSVRGAWSYPGMGLFPLEYMHGNAWSVYGVGKPGSVDKLKVEVFKLPKRPEKSLSVNGEIDGRVIKVNHVSLGMGGINFEPEEPAKRGVYWVRVSGDGVREGYLVELY
jgi:hypothetical protein